MVKVSARGSEGRRFDTRVHQCLLANSSGQATKALVVPANQVFQFVSASGSKVRFCEPLRSRSHGSGVNLVAKRLSPQCLTPLFYKIEVPHRSSLEVNDSSFHITIQAQWSLYVFMSRITRQSGM